MRIVDLFFKIRHFRNLIHFFEVISLKRKKEIIASELLNVRSFSDRVYVLHHQKISMGPAGWISG